MRDFAMFILSHGRPKNIATIKTLDKCGYTGKWYIIIDDEDKDANEYKDLYGDRVIQFCKKDADKIVDIADNFGGRNTVTYARNTTFSIAKKLGLTHYMMLDDDYGLFEVMFNKKGEFKHQAIKDLDKVIELTMDFYDKSGATCVAFAQAGDFIGGKDGMGKDMRTKRKAMNTMMCSPDKPFRYHGRMNEDVSAYILNGKVGKLFFTLNSVSINQSKTQSLKGGLTDMYLQFGTYVKSFYSVMHYPSAVKISKMGWKDMRIHHKICWNHAVPCIIEEKFRK